MSIADTIEFEDDQSSMSERERLEAFWSFVSERHQIYERRIHAVSDQPWTEDPILRKYKFTNTFRAADRVSQFVIQNVLGDPKSQVKEQIFRVILFRIFNNPATWNQIVSALGETPSTYNFDPDYYTSILTDASLDGIQLWNPAYTISPPDNGYSSKHECWLHNLDDMLRDGLLMRVANMHSLQGIYAMLRAMPTVGNFYAFQWAIDINYSRHFSFPEETFVVAGPGAIRGFHKVLPAWDRDRADTAILWLESVQEAELASRGLAPVKLGGVRTLKPVDIQNCLCEFDKYSRERYPMLNINGAQIKQLFTPHVGAIGYKFPQHWKIPAFS